MLDNYAKIADFIMKLFYCFVDDGVLIVNSVSGGPQPSVYIAQNLLQCETVILHFRGVN